MAEDGGFEPPRVLSQHDFQSCALGHYANPPAEEITRVTHASEIGLSAGHPVEGPHDDDVLARALRAVERLEASDGEEATGDRAGPPDRAVLGQPGGLIAPEGAGPALDRRAREEGAAGVHLRDVEATLGSVGGLLEATAVRPAVRAAIRLAVARSRCRRAHRCHNPRLPLTPWSAGPRQARTAPHYERRRGADDDGG